LSKGSERAAAVMEHLSAQRDEMVEMLLALSRLESPTDVVASQAAVQRQLTDALEELGFGVSHRRGHETGGFLFAKARTRVRGRPAQLLIGHCDTVWPLGTTQSMPVVHEDGIVRGPGTFDMKAGLVQGIFALRALRDLGHEPPLTPVWFINSDEETGSPESQRYVALVARHVDRTFVLEPSLGPAGDLKTARKGVGRYVVTVNGKAAHSGLDPTGGASAIQELSHVIQRLHALTDHERGLTVNVGVIHGGTRANVIAAAAEAVVDVRIMTVADGKWIDGIIRGLEATVPGTSISVSGGVEVPPLERTPRNRALWHAAQGAAERLGIPLGEQISGGGSDGNTTSQFTATLDGLGAVGDGAHARHEHVVAARMPERAALVAELLMTPGDEA
jgi:glutamate carboxypeptidase